MGWDDEVGHGPTGEPWGEPPDALLDSPRLQVVLTAHARRQLDELGPPAAEALEYLSSMGRDEIAWTAESLPPQHGRELWLLWAGGVRILFDIEDDDLCVQGFGLTPRRSRR